MLQAEPSDEFDALSIALAEMANTFDRIHAGANLYTGDETMAMLTLLSVIGRESLYTMSGFVFAGQCGCVYVSKIKLH